MTESCGMCAIMPPEVFRYDTVGLPVPSIEIKVFFCFSSAFLFFAFVFSSYPSVFVVSRRFPFGLSSVRRDGDM
jgi:hypothetical protein